MIPKKKTRELFSFDDAGIEFKTFNIRYDVICDDVQLCVIFNDSLIEIKRNGLEFYRKKAEALFENEIKKQGLSFLDFKDMQIPRGYITPKCLDLLLRDV